MRPSIQAVLWLGLAALIILIVFTLHAVVTSLPQRSYSDFLDDIERGDIATITIKAGTINGTDRQGRRFSTFSPDVPGLIPLLRNQQVEVVTEAASPARQFIDDLLVVILLLGGWLIFSRKQTKHSKRFIHQTKTANRHGKLVPTSFADVAGISEAREELKEITDFLKDPGKFSRLGGRIPHGVLLQGPPGTGKTLLAKAIAGEASVPFYSIGGSDFVEMFAGLGASRVRELFSEAKKQAPCIIFIDEIDAIGGKRSVQYQSGSNDERAQTLNALLVEMDGFASNETIIVVAATNRPDMLDSALLRPGRFDRRITLTLPDIKGRQKILEVHCRKTAVDQAVDLSVIAKGTPGFSGAEIANLVNEAALLAARRQKERIELIDFEDAKDKIIMGLERKNAVISVQARRLAAYHEAGHAVAAKLLKETDPLHKITIIPRGQALGLTQQLPLDDQHTYSHEYLVNRINILLGGRLAEEVIFGRKTTGASNDLKLATDIAHRIVCEFGMSERIGPISCCTPPETDGQGLGISGWTQSQQTLREIDEEISAVMSSCHRATKRLISTHSEFLHMLAESLLLHETLDGDEVDIIYRCYGNRRLSQDSQVGAGERGDHHERETKP